MLLLSGASAVSLQQLQAPPTVHPLVPVIQPPQKPKAAISAYMYFCHAKTPEVKEAAELKHPGVKLLPGERVAILGPMWKVVKDTAEARPFHEMAKRDKARHDAEMAKMTR